MPRKPKPSPLTRDLLQRFDESLLWTYGGPSPGLDATPDLKGILRGPVKPKDYIEDADTRRRLLHATLDALARQGVCLERVWWVLFTAREQEIVCRAEWAAIDHERTRRRILERVPRYRPEWRWLRQALAERRLSQRSTRDRRGPLGAPWLAKAEAALKALGVKPRHRRMLFEACALLPLSIAK